MALWLFPVTLFPSTFSENANGFKARWHCDDNYRIVRSSGFRLHVVWTLWIVLIHIVEKSLFRIIYMIYVPASALVLYLYNTYCWSFLHSLKPTFWTVFQTVDLPTFSKYNLPQQRTYPHFHIGMLLIDSITLITTINNLHIQIAFFVVQ